MKHPALIAVIVAAAFLFACGVSDASVDPGADPEPPVGEVNPSGKEQALSSMPACGTALAWYDGVASRSNGGNTGTGYSCGGTGNYGYQYQCVELVMRYFTIKWGLRWYGNARDLLNNAPRDRVDVFWNGDSAHPPVPGDMVVWRNGTYGHVALITAVGASYVDILEQNVVSNGTARLPYGNGYIGARWGDWIPSGWAHAKANTNKGTTSGAWQCGNSSYNGSQFWTCSGGNLHKCSNGVPQQTTCSAGCFTRPVGTNDLCINTTTTWSCGNSSWNGGQYWTCSGGTLYKCVNGSARKVACPSGCNVGPLGTDDTCR